MPDIVSLSLDSYKTGGEPHDPSDRWTTYEDAFEDLRDISATLKTITDDEYAKLVDRSTDSYSTVWGDAFTVNLMSPIPVTWGASVFVVVVRYSSGDTFSHVSGLSQVYDAFASREEADALAATINREADTRPEARNGIIDEWNFTHEGRSYHKCWVGYFERFEDVSVHTVTIR